MKAPMIMYIKYWLTISLLMLVWHCRSQTAIKRIFTYELINNKKRLSRIDSFDLKGNKLLTYIFRGHFITSAGAEENNSEQPEVIRHFEYDHRNRLVNDYNEYPGIRITSQVSYKWTDTTITGYHKAEGKDENIKMWQRTINGYRDTVQFLEYSGVNGELTSGERSLLTYDKNQRLTGKKKYILKGSSKMIWQPANYREQFFYSGTSVYPDSVYNYFQDGDSLVFIMVNRYNSKGHLTEKIYKTRNRVIERKIDYTYGTAGVQKVIENSAGTKPRITTYSYDSKGRVKELSVMEGQKIIRKYWYINEYY